MPSPDRDPNAGGPTTGENTPGGENTPESLPDREDRRRQEETSGPKNTSRREEDSRREGEDCDDEGEGQWPASGPIPAVIEARSVCALSGDALKVYLSVSGRSGPLQALGASARRVPAVAHLWGIQAPRPGRICKGKRLRVAARSAGPEGRIAGSVVAEGKETSERQDVGRALIRRGLAWQDQRGPSSAQLRSLEQEARREKVGLWQQADPTPPWAR